jgi:hypothetical protein
VPADPAELSTLAADEDAADPALEPDEYEPDEPALDPDEPEDPDDCDAPDEPEPEPDDPLE